MKRICADSRAAGRIPANGAKVVQSLQTAALALPVTDGIVDERQFAEAPEVGYREYRFENALKPWVIALVRQKIHLQKALVGLLLDLDQVRDRDRSLNLRKINSFAGGAV